MEEREKPNILFVLADDLGWGDVGYHGSEIRTPNIDRLADSGVELDQHYVCPVCTPTRASLLTGRYPSRFGRHATVPSNVPVLPDGYETLATSLRNCGYDTGLFGKWHLGSEPAYAPNHYGFDYSYGSLAGGVDPYNHRYKYQQERYTYTWHRNGQLMDEPGHVTDLIGQEAINWIQGRKNPWFCYVAFTAVHVPVKAPQAWLDRYSNEVYDSDPDRDRSFKAYAAYASHMDHTVGNLIETLKELCVSDKTIVVFGSDNGSIPGDPRSDGPNYEASRYPGFQEKRPRLGSNLPLRGYKGQLYEGGVRTPAFISWPGTLTSHKMEAPIQIADWMPTFTKLAGYVSEADPQWDGVDIWPLLTGEAEQITRPPLFWNLKGSNFAVRDNEWKLIAQESEKQRHTELYNIGADPYETKDLASGNPDMVEDLLEMITHERKLDDSSKRDDAP